MPLITRRSSTRALPRVSVGRCGLIFENCAFVSQHWSRLIYASFPEAVNHATTLVPTFLWVQTLGRFRSDCTGRGYSVEDPPCICSVHATARSSKPSRVERPKINVARSAIEDEFRNCFTSRRRVQDSPDAMPRCNERPS